MSDPVRRVRQEAVYKDGLDAPIVANSIRIFDNIVIDAEAALTKKDLLAGIKYSLADATAKLYISRLDALKLLPVWAKTAPRVLDWYARIKERRSFKAMLTDYLTVEDIARFDAIDDRTADKAREILNARVILYQITLRRFRPGSPHNALQLRPKAGFRSEFRRAC
jgi:hypothetical protein